MGSESVIQMPEVPRELWMLWSQSFAAATGDPADGWCVALDDPPGAENFLVCFTEQEAKAAAEHQGNMYDLTDLIPVRVK